MAMSIRCFYIIFEYFQIAEMDGKDKEQESQNPLGDLEEFFPATNKIETINQNIANSDAKTMHDKMEKYN